MSCRESIWIFKLGLRFLQNSISNNQIFPGTFLKLLIGFFFQEVVAAVSFYEMSTDCRMFVLSNALMKVSGCVPDLICIAQITRETLNNALPIHNWRLDFFGFKILPQFQALKNRLQCMEKIAQLLPNRISGHLIFEWKTTVFVWL